VGIGAKPKAPLAGRKAVAEALERRNIKAKVTSYELCPTIYQITFQLTSFPRISIIIPTKNSLSLVKKCIHSVRQHTNYPNYEILIINNASDDTEFLEYTEREESENRIKVLHYDKPFNHSGMNNIAVASINSEFVVFMNNDIEIISDEWLEQLVAIIQMDESIAGVGALLLYPNGTVQHGGIIWGLNGTAGHAHKYVHSGLPGYFGRLHTLQEMSGITAALALIRRSSFEQVGGFESNRYPTLYNDVDICIRLRKKGYRCIYNPMVRAIHYETKTRPVNPEEFFYKQRLASDYAEILNSDPFYNPNLTLGNEQFHGYRSFPIEKQIPELRDIRKQTV
jgi:GT2 family glycosyltransferase